MFLSPRCDDGAVSIRSSCRACLHPHEQRYCIRWLCDISATTIASTCQMRRNNVREILGSDWTFGDFFVFGVLCISIIFCNFVIIIL